MRKKKKSNQTNSQNYVVQQNQPYVQQQHFVGTVPGYTQGQPTPPQQVYYTYTTPEEYQQLSQYPNGYYVIPQEYLNSNGEPQQFINGYYIPQGQYIDGYFIQPQQFPYEFAAQTEEPSSDNKKKKAKRNKKSKNNNNSQKPPRKKKNKIFISVIASLVSISVVLGILGLFGNLPFVNYDSKGDFEADSTAQAAASVTFNDEVYIIKDLDAVQKKFKNVTLNGNKYTITYSKELPLELANLTEGQLFCVPSDSTSKELCFKMGFCGQIEVSDKDSLTFTVPSMEKIFDSFSFELQENSLNSTQFVTAEGVSIENVTPAKTVEPQSLFATQLGVTPKIGGSESFKIGAYSITPEFSYKKPSTTPVRDGYVMLCDSLKLGLEVEKESEEDENKKTAVSGSITLEDLAAKMNIDWHKNANDEVIIDEYDVGFATYETTDLTFKDTLEIGLDDLVIDTDLKTPIIQIEDSSKYDDGKLNLGSFTFGIDAGIFETGVSLELFIAGSGEIEVSCELSTQGFVMAEADSESYSTIFKCYDYPSPVLYEGTEPCALHENYEDCVPSASTKIELDISARLALGFDLSLNILGLTPMKLENNLLEIKGSTHLEDEYNGSVKELGLVAEKDLVELYQNFSSLKAGSNSIFKFYLGAKLGEPLPLEMDLIGLGYEKVLFNKTWTQIPEPIEFKHSECGFGDIYINQYYTQSELEETFQQYVNDNELNSFIANIKDTTGNAVIESLSDTLGIALDDLDITESGNIKYYSLGAIYLRDENDKVTGAIITGKDIKNKSGLCPGISTDMVETIYSAPATSDHIEFNVSYIIKEFLEQSGVFPEGVPNKIDLTIYTYKSTDSEEDMMLLFSEDSLAAIIITE